jgi:hypothetical protein
MDKTITVASFRKDDYGNMHIKDSEGNEHKVGAKRSQLFPFIEQSVGHDITLKYREYQGKEYIAEVEPANAPAVVKEAVKQGAVIVEEKKKGNNRSYALSYAKDIGVAMITAGKEFSSKEVLDLAKEFNDYLDGE